MSLNVERVGSDQPLAGGGLPSTSMGTSIDRPPSGSGPSATIRSPDRPAAGSKPGHPKGIKSLKIGAGIRNDIYSRIPYYASDWTDAWNYRVVPATTLIFFAKYGVSPIERPDLRDLFQCSSRYCFLFGPHRDYRKVWCCGSFAFFCNGCRDLLGVRRTTIVHSRRHRHVSVVQAPKSLGYSSSSHRPHYRVEQDDLRYSRQDSGCAGLPAVYGMGIPLGRGTPLGVGSSKL